jgi:hypothetical protein
VWKIAKALTAAGQRFVSCVRSLPPDQAAPIRQAAAAELQAHASRSQFQVTLH